MRQLDVRVEHVAPLANVINRLRPLPVYQQAIKSDIGEKLERVLQKERYINQTFEKMVSESVRTNSICVYCDKYKSTHKHTHTHTHTKYSAMSTVR